VGDWYDAPDRSDTVTELQTAAETQESDRTLLACALNPRLVEKVGAIEMSKRECDTSVPHELRRG
jgi:hypothetical protein